MRGTPQPSPVLPISLNPNFSRASHTHIHTSLAIHTQVRKAYGSRWTKQIDGTTRAPYYYDRATGMSQWERPVDFDEVEGAAAPPPIDVFAEPMTPERAKLLLSEVYRKVRAWRVAGWVGGRTCACIRTSRVTKGATRR